MACVANSSAKLLYLLVPWPLTHFQVTRFLKHKSFNFTHKSLFLTIFYRGFIPFLFVFIGLLIIQKNKLFSSLINNGWHGVGYIFTFIVTNILFIISIENTNVANTLIMISLAPMLSALISFVFLKEYPDKKTWIAIIITTLAVIYIFFDSFERGDVKGNFYGFICAMGLAAGAVITKLPLSEHPQVSVTVTL